MKRNVPVLRWPSDRAKHWVTDFLARVAHDDSVLGVVAVGSSVRPNVESTDLDLLVVRRGVAQPSQAPIEVDVREYAAEDVEDRIKEGHDLLGWALRFGALLYERDQYWTTLRNRYRNRLPFPSAESARARAVRARNHLENIISVGDMDAAAEQLVAVLTHLARAALLDAHIYPKSRPELADQLAQIGETELANLLQRASKAAKGTGDASHAVRSAMQYLNSAAHF